MKTGLAEKLYPYVKLLPDAERELWPPFMREDVIERRVREVEHYLNQVPVYTFRLTNVLARIKTKIEYEKQEGEEPSLVFDYVLGRHKAVSLSMRELLQLPELVAVRILFTPPKKNGVEGDYELAGLVTVPNWPVYFIKPDFITAEQKDKKSPRWIPFRSGFARLVLEIENADGTVDRIKLAEGEIYWIRHSKPCDGIAYIMRKKGARREEVNREWKKCRESLKKIADIRDHFTLLLVHTKVREPSGRWREQWYYLLRNFAVTAKQARNKTRFGNQEFEIVKVKQYKALVEEKVAEGYKFVVYNHVFRAWFRKTQAKKKGAGAVTVSRFTVYKLKPLTDGEEWYLIVPHHKNDRIEVINKHHWGEGWGRLFVELREGEALLFRHRKLYPKIEVFLP
jgi:hypothetical protein